MMDYWARIGFTAGLLLLAGAARAEEKEVAVVEIGGAGEWGLQHGGSAAGPNVAVEFDVIEHWLEIEVGVTPLFSNGQAEVGTDLVFKKPFDLSDSVEFLIGAGPEWVHKASGEKPADSVAGEAIVELIYFPWPEHKTGFFIEQSYGYDFGKGHEQSLGVSGGLHIAVP
ncbi:MAG: hypothetical protein ACLP7P_14870 [Rhodomicrobium sp.]